MSKQENTFWNDFMLITSYLPLILINLFFVQYFAPIIRGGWFYENENVHKEN